jgi:hypothetical protein
LAVVSAGAAGFSVAGFCVEGAAGFCVDGAAGFDVGAAGFWVVVCALAGAIARADSRIELTSHLVIAYSLFIE